MTVPTTRSLRARVTILALCTLLLSGCGAPVAGWPGLTLAGTSAYVLSPGYKLLAVNLDARSRAVPFPAEGEWQFPRAKDDKLGGTYSAPVLSAGTVYFTTYQAGGLFGRLYALNEMTGEVRWQFEPGGTANSMVGSPTIADGTVYIGSDDHRVYALDAASGTRKWDFQTKNKVWAKILAEGEMVYAASLDHHLYALDRTTGQLKWQMQTGGSLASMPAYDRGTLYFGSADGVFYAVSAGSGQTVWEQDLGSWVWGTPLVQGGIVYAGTLARQIHALDATTGERRWAAPVVGQVSATPVLAERVLAVADQSGRVYGLDPATGSRRWEYLTDPQAPIHAALGAERGKLYVMSLNRKLVALNLTDGRAEWSCPTGGEQVCR